MHRLTSRFAMNHPVLVFAPIPANPGLFYNIGNAIAFFGAISAFVLQAMLAHSLSGIGLVNHLVGSASALLTTLATCLFWVSGLCYAKAWANGFPPLPASNRRGHALSTLGALFIGLALIVMARTEVALALALMATILHAGGKWVSWKAPDADQYFKPMPLYSRVCYVTTVLLDLRSDLLASASLDDAVASLALPAFLLVATVFWARADWLLLPKQEGRS